MLDLNSGEFIFFALWPPVLVGLMVIAWGTFGHLAWSWPGVRSIVRRPDLRGTWGGMIRSSWGNDAGGAQSAPIESYLIVHQTFSAIHLRLLTPESQSVTLAASLVREIDGRITLSGVYRNEPRLSLRGHSPIHHGGLVLRVEGSPAASMAGQYWTDRRSDGELEFRLLTRRYVSDFYAAQSLAAGVTSFETKGSVSAKGLRPVVSQRVDAPAKGRNGNHFLDEGILEIHKAAIACGLDRDALLSGVDPGLIAQFRGSVASGPQLLSDLHALNGIGHLDGGSVPMRTWLMNAQRLSSPRTEHKVFQKYLALVSEASPGPGHQAASI